MRCGWRLPRRLISSLFHDRCRTELLGRRVPRHSHFVHRVQQQPPFLGDRLPDGARGRRPPRAQALLQAPARPGAEGTSGSVRAGRRAGMDGRTSPHGGASSGPAAARPDPPSTPAGMARLVAPQPRQVWWAPAGREAGVGQARFPRHGPGGQRRRRGPPVRARLKYEALCSCSPAATPVRSLRQQAQPQVCQAQLCEHLGARLLAPTVLGRGCPSANPSLL